MPPSILVLLFIHTRIRLCQKERPPVTAPNYVDIFGVLVQSGIYIYILGKDKNITDLNPGPSSQVTPDLQCRLMEDPFSFLKPFACTIMSNPTNSTRKKNTQVTTFQCWLRCLRSVDWRFCDLSTIQSRVAQHFTKVEMWKGRESLFQNNELKSTYLQTIWPMMPQLCSVSVTVLTQSPNNQRTSFL